MVYSVLFSLEGSAARYPPGPLLGKPLPPEGQSQPAGRRRDTISLEGSAARSYPPGPRLGKPLPPPLALQNVGVVGRRICHFSSSSSRRVLARGMDANGGGRRPLQIASFAIRFHSRGLR